MAKQAAPSPQPPAPRLRIEVVYALRDEQLLVALEAEEGITARQAIERSGIRQRFPGVDVGLIGIFGKIVEPDTPLRDGDRVEIYRPLVADPKEARRKKAKGPRTR